MSRFQGNASPVDLKILLPDREVVTVSVRKNANTEEVYTAITDKIKMSKSTAKYFALFEIVEYNFGEYLRWSFDMWPSWLVHKNSNIYFPFIIQYNNS